MTFFRLFTLTILVMLTTFVPASQTKATDQYPTRPVRLITGFAAGATTDLVARLLGQKLSEKWRQPVIVDNRPGADTTLALSAAAKSPPDGHTLVLSTIGHVLAPTLHTLNYDPIKDLTPVSLLLTQPAALVVQPSFEANSLKELIALARKYPGKLNYGTGGQGTFPYVAMSLLIARTGIDMVNINYRGGSPTIIALIRGEIQMTFQTIAGIAPQVQSGELKALAVTSKDRIPAMPDVPTVIEAADLPGYDANNWYGILAPGGTPQPIISKLHKDFVAVLALPEIQNALSLQGLQTIGSSPSEFDEMIKREIPRWAGIFKSIERKGR